MKCVNTALKAGNKAVFKTFKIIIYMGILIKSVISEDV